jgi:hypothetical protein
MSAETKAFRAKIVSINEEIQTKKNGKEFITCRVQFTNGPLVGKVYFANRTLGDEKNEIAVEQDVLTYLTVVENTVTDAEGKVTIEKRPFFEISTSIVDDTDELVALLGL